ncbi:zinc finger CCCH domain-containing protein 43 isoform X1 [Lactuca sativa]|uniref:zinc finger CCCH domain-containing protein 43 isoform X1 n=1 Tax=Lactuca sativa TaxID=4236 RepID=UPI000CD91ED0|nr:zinc finger CCCH domain-containing protein 43 isoform X1 [Lactuca sativa]
MDAFEENSQLNNQQQQQQHIDLGLQSDSSINNDKLVEDITKELQNLVVPCKDKLLDRDLQGHSVVTDEEDEVKRAIDEELRHLLVKEAVNEAFQADSSSGSGEKYFRDVRQFVDEAIERNGLKKVREEDPKECRVLEEREVGETGLECEKDGGNVVDVNGDADEKAVEHKEMDSKENHEIEIEDGDDTSEIVGYESNGEDKRSEGGNEKEFEDGEDLENENENAGGEGDEGGPMTVPGGGGSKRYHYPLRPDAEDCSYYMRTGMCKFGSNCKFNHPLRRRNQQPTKETKIQKEENSERHGQVDCKFYLSTGGCKYGKSCKFSHGRGKTAVTPVVEYNFLGLPIRPGEKECPYYMRNGSCKYGPNCRFNHPDPTAVGGVGGDSAHSHSPTPYGNDGPLPNMPPWSPQRTPDTPAAFLPVMYSPPPPPPQQHIPPPTPDWNGYQAPVPPPPPPAHVYPSSERGLPIPPAFFLNNPPTDANLYTHQHQNQHHQPQSQMTHQHQHQNQHQHPHQHHQPQSQMMGSDYPERPGQPECSYFMKTGDCKYRSGCKFHHPKSRITKTAPSVLSDKGLPLRPEKHSNQIHSGMDQNMCTHYSRYGICKYGPACKYDHSPNSNSNSHSHSNSNSIPGEGYRSDGHLMQQSM